MSQTNKLGLIGWFLIIIGLVVKAPIKTPAQIFYFVLLVLFSTIFLMQKNRQVR